MPNYTKLFNSIITSTIWSEDDKTRIIWITMLAMSDKNGEVHSSIPGLARVSGMSIAEAESSIAKLMAPDSYSRTPDNEGRRIAKIDGGWELLNHAKYRAMASKEDAKAATAERVRRHRERNADVTVGNADVTVGRDIADTYTDTYAEREEPPAGILPQNWKRLSKAEQQRIKVNFNDPTMIRIGKWFKQRETTLWTVAECVALQQVDPSEDDLNLIGDHYSYEIDKNGYRYTTISILLNNWSSARSKANLFFEENKITRNA